MSERTLESRFARSRAVEICDFKRESSVRCCERISRCRARLVDLRAEVVASESRMRESWPIRAERWVSVSVGRLVRVIALTRLTFSSISFSCSSVFCSSSLGLGSTSDFAAKRAYVWNSDSVWWSLLVRGHVVSCLHSTDLCLCCSCLLSHLRPRCASSCHVGYRV